MLQMTITGQWGTSPIEEVNPDTGEIISGRQITVIDNVSGIVVNVPFVGGSIPTLIKELATSLTPDQKRELTQAFTGGIVVTQQMPKEVKNG